MPYYCVLCRNSGVVMHMFPNPKKHPERFQAWLDILGNKKPSLPNQEIYIKKRICDIHFTSEHRNRFSRLNALATPTLYLTGNTKDLPVTLQTADISDHRTVIPATHRNASNLHLADDDELYNIIKIPDSLRDHTYYNLIAATVFPQQCRKEDCSINTKKDLKGIENDNILNPENAPNLGDDLNLVDGLNLNDDINLEDALNPEETIAEPLLNDALGDDDQQSFVDLTLYDEPAPCEIDVHKEQDQYDDGLHVGYKCNVCDSDIKGFRYVCVQCGDWDMCANCEFRGAHSRHYVLRLPGPRPMEEFNSVLERMRRELFEMNVFIENRVKEEDDILETDLKADPFYMQEETVETTLPEDEIEASECPTIEEAQEICESLREDMPSSRFVSKSMIQENDENSDSVKGKKELKVKKKSNSIKLKKGSKLKNKSDSVKVTEELKVRKRRGNELIVPENIPKVKLLKLTTVKLIPNKDTLTKLMNFNEKFKLIKGQGAASKINLIVPR